MDSHIHYSTDISSARTDVHLTHSSRVVDSSVKKQICLNYLEGLEWTFKYYTEGCPNWKWKYHYNYPPLLADLAAHNPKNVYFVNAVCNPCTEKEQLNYVMPQNKEMSFEWAWCKYFWESHCN